MNDKRGVRYLASGATYVKIAFGDSVTIAAIELGQLPGNYSTSLTFTQFQVSFSQDDVTYAYLPPVNTNSLSFSTKINLFTIVLFRF